MRRNRKQFTETEIRAVVVVFKCACVCHRNISRRAAARSLENSIQYIVVIIRTYIIIIRTYYYTDARHARARKMSHFAPECFCGMSEGEIIIIIILPKRRRKFAIVVNAAAFPNIACDYIVHNYFYNRHIINRLGRLLDVVSV